MYKNFTDHELESFVIRGDIPNQLRSASPEFLCDLHDFVLNFGLLLEENYIRVLYLPEFGLNLNVDIDPTDKSIYVFPGEPDLKLDNSECYELDLCSSKGRLTWAKSISVDQVKEAMNAVDELQEKVGNIDGKGKRKFLGLIGESKKLIVEKVFSDVGTVVPVKKDALKKTFASFDEPHKLLFYSEANGNMAFIYHKRDETYIQVKTMVVDKILAKYGIKDFKELGDRLVDIQAEIEVMLTKMLNEKDTL